MRKLGRRDYLIKQKENKIRTGAPSKRPNAGKNQSCQNSRRTQSPRLSTVLFPLYFLFSFPPPDISLGPGPCSSYSRVLYTIVEHIEPVHITHASNHGPPRRARRRPRQRGSFKKAAVEENQLVGATRPDRDWAPSFTTAECHTVVVGPVSRVLASTGTRRRERKKKSSTK